MSNTLKVFLVALLVTTLCFFAAQSSPTPQNYSSDILRLAKAAQIKAYLNDDKDPCDNFYKFACGKWHRLQPAYEKAPKTSYLDQLQELFVRKTADMLKNEGKGGPNTDVLLKNFYESCRNEEAVKLSGLNPLLSVVDFRGGWPRLISPAWYSYEYDWLKLVAELRRRIGADIFIGLDIIPDFEDKDVHRIKVGAPQLALKSRGAYLDDDFEDLREEYKRNVTNKLHKYFTDMPFGWAKEIADQVLHIEQQLAKGLPINSRLSIKQTTRQRYASDLKAAYGNYVDLSRYLTIVFNQTIYVQVYETPEDYMSNLVEVIKNTPKLKIANYTMWRVLEHFEFAGEINYKQNDLWCARKVAKYFPNQLENMFHRHYNNIQVINELQSVWADVKKTFREQLQSSSKLNWITTDTRQKAILKLDTIELEFITHDSGNLEEQMYGLTIRPDKYYENLLSILQWDTRKKLQKLVDKPRENETEPSLPHYQRTTNKIRIPITFLQSRFFWDASYPHALKYSTLGYILAQEMLHGFDTIGRKYDKHGHQRSWWDSVSEYAFDERANCFAKQYTNYKFNGKSVNDRNVVQTAIADNGGVAIAYRAYQKWWQNMADAQLSSKETLPLLEYSHNQLFFISYAQLWCADYDDSIEQLDTTPERLRVIGALSNFNDFPKEFKCEMGTKMNPSKKCTIY